MPAVFIVKKVSERTQPVKVYKTDAQQSVEEQCYFEKRDKFDENQWGGPEKKVNLKGQEDS